ncbi:hypothetical protein BDR04DRAFT_1142719 [Suillus decipiens]|nr:hypothetical protein BDR04DRAFT_1142719 [Suillus decipiens]
MQGGSGGEPLQASGPRRTTGHIAIEEHQLTEVIGTYPWKWDKPGSAKSIVANDVSSSNGDPPPDTANLEPGAEVEQEETLDTRSRGRGKWNQGRAMMAKKNTQKESENEPSEEHVIRIASYSGPVLRLHTTVKWRGSSEEQYAIMREIWARDRFHTPSHDLHLAQEAENYQSFPDHFFQHWTGYNIVPPIHDPVPVGALCPASTSLSESDLTPGALWPRDRSRRVVPGRQARVCIACLALSSSRVVAWVIRSVEHLVATRQANRVATLGGWVRAKASGS